MEMGAVSQIARKTPMPLSKSSLTTSNASVEFTASESKRVPQLDGIRGVAVLFVILGHYLFYQPAHGIWLSYLTRATRLAWVGVDLFFVLSGFLITGILLDHKNGGNLLRVFYTRRAARILPIYVATLLGCAVFFHFLGSLGQFKWLFSNQLPGWSYATFTQNILMGWLKDYGGSFLGVTWSLAVEEQFYLIWPWVVILCRSHRQIFIICVICVIISPILRARVSDFSFVNMPFRMDSLFIGAIGAIVVRTPRVVALLKLKAGSLRLLVMFLTPPGLFVMYQNTLRALPHSIVSLWFGLILVDSLFEPMSGLARVLSWSWLRWFGSISYGLYLFHEPVRGLLHGWLLGKQPQLTTPAEAGVTILSLIVCISLAAFSAMYYESVFLRWGRKINYAGAR